MVLCCELRTPEIEAIYQSSSSPKSLLGKAQTEDGSTSWMSLEQCDYVTLKQNVTKELTATVPTQCPQNDNIPVICLLFHSFSISVSKDYSSCIANFFFWLWHIKPFLHSTLNDHVTFKETSPIKRVVMTCCTNQYSIHLTVNRTCAFQLSVQTGSAPRQLGHRHSSEYH